MALELAVTNAAGIALNYPEITRMAWDNVAGFAKISVSSWVSQVTRNGGSQPVETNDFWINGSAFMTYSNAIYAGTNVLTESENMLKAWTPPFQPTVPPTWFSQAAWSTATSIASAFTAG